MPPISQNENDWYESFQSMDILKDPKNTSYNPDNESTVNIDSPEWSCFLDDESKTAQFSEVHEKKYVVTERQLEQLFKRIHCPECASPLDKLQKETNCICFKVKAVLWSWNLLT